MADRADDGRRGDARGGPGARRRGWSERRRDRVMRNRAGLDVRESDPDLTTPSESVGTDFVNVENMRAERFPEEFPEGPYGAEAVDAGDASGEAGADRGMYQADEKGEFSVDAPVDGDEREEAEEPFDPRMVFFFDGG